VVWTSVDDDELSDDDELDELDEELDEDDDGELLELDCDELDVDDDDSDGELDVELLELLELDELLVLLALDADDGDDVDMVFDDEEIVALLVLSAPLVLLELLFRAGGLGSTSMYPVPARYRSLRTTSLPCQSVTCTPAPVGGGVITSSAQ